MKEVLSDEQGLVNTLHIESGDKCHTATVTRQWTQDIEPFLKQAEINRAENATYWTVGEDGLPKVRELVHLCDIPFVVALDIKQKTGFDLWKVNLNDPAVHVELFSIMKKLGYDSLWMKKNLA